jgi:homopolymeric O-antigen transport system ATP-binding protein
MSNEAIVSEGLSKRYRLGTAAHHYGRLSESLSNALSAPIRWVRRPGTASPNTESLWALKDVSFDVMVGQAVGIIGRNGAGKTTLLKILSRITEPTEGSALLRGRVGSLLEVGTGFHPELTGRENVYLNGAILGMSRATIKKRFDEIVEFSETGRFLETPVKRYSSGMQVRLAFAVAAHLEPEILIVDEVLAVGDVAFQRKCLGKMGSAASEGRTVLFVSHNMGTIARLCQTGMWLDEGRIKAHGPMDEVIGEYLAASAQGSSHFLVEDPMQAPGDDDVRLRSVVVKNAQGNASTYLDSRFPIHIEMEYSVLRRTVGLRTGFRLLSSDGTVIFTTRDNDGMDLPAVEQDKGTFTSRCEIPGNLLKGGQYQVTVIADRPYVKVIFNVESAVSFWVESTQKIYEQNRVGVIAPGLKWTIQRTDLPDGHGKS